MSAIGAQWSGTIVCSTPTAATAATSNSSSTLIVPSGALPPNQNLARPFSARTGVLALLDHDTRRRARPGALALHAVPDGGRDGPVNRGMAAFRVGDHNRPAFVR